MSWRFGLFYENDRPDDDGDGDDENPETEENITTRPRRRRNWQRISARWSAIFTGTIAIFTACIVAISYFQWRILDKTESTLRDTDFNNTRAWIVPAGVEINSDITVNSNLRLKILYQNSGKEPAKNMIHFRDWYPIKVTIDDVDEPYVDWSKVSLPSDYRCEQAVAIDEDGTTVYPLATYANYKYIYAGARHGSVPQSLKDKTSSVVVYGCFVYSTFGFRKQSPYCFYLQHDRLRPVEESTFDPCPFMHEDAT